MDTIHKAFSITLYHLNIVDLQCCHLNSGDLQFQIRYFSSPLQCKSLRYHGVLCLFTANSLESTAMVWTWNVSSEYWLEDGGVSREEGRKGGRKRKGEGGRTLPSRA